MSIISSKRTYKNFGGCIFLDNGIITLGVTVEEGPRIIYCSPAGEYGTWVAYGGRINRFLNAV